MFILLPILIVSFILTVFMHYTILQEKKYNKKGPPFIYGVDGKKYFHGLPVPFFEDIFTVILVSTWIISIIGGAFFLLLGLDWLMEEPILFPQNNMSTFLAQNIPQFILWGYAGIIIAITIIEALIIFLSNDYFSPYKIKIDEKKLELHRNILFYKKLILEIDFSKPYIASINQDSSDENNDRISYCFAQDKHGMAISFPKVWDNTNAIEKSLYLSESFTTSDVFYRFEPNREFEKIKAILEKAIF